MSTPWVTTKKLLEYFPISRKTLYRRKATLSYGTHWIYANPTVKNGNVLWHLKNIEAHFCRPLTPTR